MPPPDGFVDLSSTLLGDERAVVPVIVRGVSCASGFAREVEALATRRGVAPADLAAAIFLIVGPNPIEADPGPGEATLDVPAPPRGDAGSVRRALSMALALADGDVPLRDARRLEVRVESLEYRNKALRAALERVAFQPPGEDGGRMDARDAAGMFGFVNERCFDESMVRRRFRELAPVYHPDTGVVGCRRRMALLIEARDVLVSFLRVRRDDDRRRA